MARVLPAVFAAFAIAATARAQSMVGYKLRVDSSDFSAISVEMRIVNPPATLRLAMAAHPEYDDRFWRYVEGLRAEVNGAAATLVREDSALWRVSAPPGDVLVRYRIQLPARQGSTRAAWRPFLAPTGGLVGGPQSFMYVVGAERAPSQVTLELPGRWAVATSLPGAGDSRTFNATDAKTMLEAPMLVGQLRLWRFAVNGVPHRIFYWPLPNAAPFDTATFVGDVERLTREGIRLFGGAPWHDYTFLYQDGAFGALEHANSVTIGALSTDLAKDPHAATGQTAHEFFHAWNLMRIRPLGYGELDYRPPAMSKGLWFSEGLSMFYADLLRIRAGLPLPDSTRAVHLERLIGRYLSSPGNSHLSAERVSEAAFAAVPGTLGDYDASTHLQGELIGAMLDFIIRDATNGQHSIDGLMRAMNERYAGDHGFTSRDVEQRVAAICGCNVTPFFDAHVRGGEPIDFDRYLRLAGMRTRITWGTALESDGKPSVDRRLRAWLPEGSSALSLVVWHPASAWARAGLHTGDRITNVNGAPMTSAAGFRTMLGALHVGDTVHVDVARANGPFRAAVVIAPFDRPFVHVEADPAATEKQRAIRARWAAGKP
ncbi:MAG TPA: PDZ domain-containing protein [Gemmatimonadaceae bacterium]|nr:PDZ domain-containing protein [Gemmatimonadaceae bacterium]